MKKSFGQFLSAQWTSAKLPEPVDLQDQTVVITGANSGLGFASALDFARMNPGKLILACRNLERGREALTSTWI